MHSMVMVIIIIVIMFCRHFSQTFDGNTRDPHKSLNYLCTIRFVVLPPIFSRWTQDIEFIWLLCARLAILPNNIIIFRVGWFHSFNFFVHECKLLWKLWHLSFFKYFMCAQIHTAELHHPFIPSTHCLVRVHHIYPYTQCMSSIVYDVPCTSTILWVYPT